MIYHEQLILMGIYLSVICMKSTFSQKVTVHTNLGQIIGETLTYETGNINRFRGVPYAKPPVGDLRFKYPQEPDPWTTPREAMGYSDKCSQPALSGVSLSVQGSEDCLYLNVFTPQGGSDLAVMFWIHGGSLQIGSSSEYPGETLASVGNVVVVTINYRLGPIGFFTDGTDQYPGNAGLADQIMALKWVKSNIAQFGGDPSKVTIFGESSGSYSVNVHMVSPAASYLFKRAISQSGTVLGLFLDTDNERAVKNQRFGAGLGCEDLETSKLTTCIKQKNAEQLITLTITNTTYLSPFVLTTGNDILPEHPDYYWEQLELNAVEYILGVNSDDGDVYLWDKLDNIQKYYIEGISIDDPAFYSVADISLLHATGGVPQYDGPVWKALLDHYILNASDPISNLRGLLDMSRDSSFVAGTMKCINAMSKSSKLKPYLYYFDADFIFDHSVGILNLPTAPALEFGAGHAIELPFVFGWALNSEANENSPYAMFGETYDDDVITLSKAMITSWTSFAKTGIPSMELPRGQLKAWPLYNNETQKYTHFVSGMTRNFVQSRLLPQSTSFWNELMPAYWQVKTMGTTEPSPKSTNVKPPPDSSEESSPNTIAVSTPRSTMNIEDNEEKEGKVTEKVRNDKENNRAVSGCDEDSSSLINRTTAETIMFFLIIALIISIVALVIFVIKYCQLNKELSEKTRDKQHSKATINGGTAVSNHSNHSPVVDDVYEEPINSSPQEVMSGAPSDGRYSGIAEADTIVAPERCSGPGSLDWNESEPHSEDQASITHYSVEKENSSGMAERHEIEMVNDETQ